MGKSTLFNRLTRSRSAIVADIPGVSRDRHFGHGKVGSRPFLVVDTGGLDPQPDDQIYQAMARQTLLAVDESDVVLFMVDGRQGLTSQDRSLGQDLRKRARRLLLVVNKAEGVSAAHLAEFHELGLGDPLAISAEHGQGVRELMELALEGIPPDPEPADDGTGGPKIAVVGRPNVGKSTLVNSVLGDERVIALDQPGTTRDSIYIDFERSGRPYTLIDTAGMRRRGKRDGMIEKFSVVKTLQAIEDANVVILLLDARQGISDQDAHIAGFVQESGRALVVGINKWDGLSPDDRTKVKRDYARKLQFLDFAKVHHLSALTGKGVSEVLVSVDHAYAAAFAKLSTPRLSRTLAQAVVRQPPPRLGMFRPKPRYAHQGGSNPPLIVIHGNQLEALPDSYRRYLARCFIEAFELVGTPLRIQLNRGRNPYAKED